MPFTPHPPRAPSAQQGFTIAEMAMVLAVIALILGGVLGGQALLQTAGVTNVTRDMQRIKISVSTFYDKYNSLPGDMPNAVAYWGAAGGNATDNYTTTCSAFSGTGTQTCNGNGDTKVGASHTDYEVYIAWQHLANAGLWGGKFTGIKSIASGQSVAGDNPGTNLPMGRYTQGGRQATYKLLYDKGDLYDATAEGTFLQIAGSGTGINACCGAPFIDGGAILATDAYNIDKKIDDGLPAFGALQIQANYWNTGPCATSATASSAAYSIVETGAIGTCTLFYDMGIKN